ncbi:hypothetical protein [Bernardetia sp.]|uniref:hypothetical protein n=1 Tax=Bernardetia sp. TaxID=1937974 RepID=UPI0025BD8E62|nr:hypothetical protein [Bernardetia sp.]
MTRIVFVLFLLVIPFLSAKAQENSINSADSLQIQEYLKVLNSKEFEQKYYGIHIYEQYDESNIVYAPDSSFKVFTFNGEFVSTSITKVSKSYLHFLDNQKKTTKAVEANFKNIIAIHQLSYSNYLVLEAETIGNPFDSDCLTTLTAIWIEIDKEKNIFQRKIIDQKKEEKDKKLMFSSYECGKIESDKTSKVYFKKETKQLVFRCVTKSANEPYKYIFYDWNGKLFVFVKEETMFFPVD